MDNFTFTTIISTSTATLTQHIPELVLYVILVIKVTLGEVISILGIAGNVLNVLVFVRQGFKVTVNITLTALAVSDLGALVSLQVFNVLVNPWLNCENTNISPTDISVVVSFTPHNYFIRVCGFTTVFATFEKCLCVALPLKFKAYITKNLVLGVNITIYIMTLLNVFPVYYTTYLDWVFSPERNKSILQIVFNQNRERVFRVSYFITDLFIPYLQFIIIIVCTVITTIKLQQRLHWRSTNTRSTTQEQISKKETKVIKMLSIVAVIFVVSLLPQTGILTAVGVVRGLSIHGTHFDITLMMFCVSYLLEIINSSVSVIVYYNMSTKYRQTFKQLKCGLCAT